MEVYKRIRNIHPFFNSALTLIPAALLVMFFSPLLILGLILYKIYFQLLGISRFKSSIILFLKSLMLYFLFISLFIIIFYIPLSLVLALIHIAPIYLKWPVLGTLIYIIFLIYITSLDHKDEIAESLKKDKWNSYDEKKELISMKDHKENKAINFIVKKGYVLFIAFSSICLVGGVSLLICLSFTINEIFPGLFYNGSLNDGFYSLRNWSIYYFFQILRVIPIDFLSPFLPEIESYTPTKIWGELLEIFCQLNLAFLLYSSIYFIFMGHRINAFKKNAEKSMHSQTGG